MPTKPESRADGDALEGPTSMEWPFLARSGVMVDSEDTDARYSLALNAVPVTVGKTAVTMVDTAEPPTLNSNLPKRS
jgi:hypothetical protein